MAGGGLLTPHRGGSGFSAPLTRIQGLSCSPWARLDHPENSPRLQVGWLATSLPSATLVPFAAQCNAHEFQDLGCGHLGGGGTILPALERLC